MSSDYNKGRARQLLLDVPNGTVTFRDTIPWVVKVLVFLLCRYIDDEE